MVRTGPRVYSATFDSHSKLFFYYPFPNKPSLSLLSQSFFIRLSCNRVRSQNDRFNGSVDCSEAITQVHCMQLKSVAKAWFKSIGLIHLDKRSAVSHFSFTSPRYHFVSYFEITRSLCKRNRKETFRVKHRRSEPFHPVFCPCPCSS